MTDPKTTITALVTALAIVLGYFHVALPDAVWVAISAVGIALFGLFAKDKKPAP